MFAGLKCHAWEKRYPKWIFKCTFLFKKRAKETKTIFCAVTYIPTVGLSFFNLYSWNLRFCLVSNYMWPRKVVKPETSWVQAAFFPSHSAKKKQSYFIELQVIK